MFFQIGSGPGSQKHKTHCTYDNAATAAVLWGGGGPVAGCPVAGAHDSVAVGPSFWEPIAPLDTQRTWKAIQVCVLPGRPWMDSQLDKRVFCAKKWKYSC